MERLDIDRREPWEERVAGGTLKGTQTDTDRHGGSTVQLTLSRPLEPDVAPVELLDLPVAPSVPVVATSTWTASPMDIVDEWGMQSFPASDPPANW
jgi:hypothetical protein